MTTASTSGPECVDPEVGALLTQYGLGTLESDDAIRFEHHLLCCPACQIELDQAANILEALAEHRLALVARAEREAEDFDSQMARLESRAAQTARAAKRERISWREVMSSFWVRWVAGPAIAVAIIFAFVLQRSPQVAPVVDNTVTESPRDTAQTQIPTDLLATTPTDDLNHESTGDPAHRPASRPYAPSPILKPMISVSASSLAMVTRSRQDGDTALQPIESALIDSQYVAVITRGKELLRGRRQDGRLLLMMGGAYYETGQLESALNIFTRAEPLVLGDAKDEVVKFQARIMVRQGNLTGARTALDRLNVPDAAGQNFATKWIPILDSLIADSTRRQE